MKLGWVLIIILSSLAISLTVGWNYIDVKNDVKRIAIAMERTATSQEKFVNYYRQECESRGFLLIEEEIEQ